MSFRNRLVIAFVAATMIPLLLFGLRARSQISSRLTTQYQRRVNALALVVKEDLERDRGSIAARLTLVARSLAEDDRFRLATLRGGAGDRSYLLDLGGQLMRLTSLSMFQIQDQNGRIISSGHFRNEFDRVEPELTSYLTASADGFTLVRARAPEGPFLVLARVDSLRVAGQRFTVVGGLAVDHAYLARFARDPAMSVTLTTPAGVVEARGDSSSAGGSTAPRTGDAGVAPPGVRPPGATAPEASSTEATDGPLGATISLTYFDAAELRPSEARLAIAHSVAELDAIRGSVDLWLLAAFVTSLLVAGGIAVWLSMRLSRPLAELAEASSTLDLEGSMPVFTAAESDDEVGVLARTLGAMARRLRVGATKLREAERRATVGEMAQQVNHDVKNGLIPIRNVLRHLTLVQEQHPEQLATVFAERRATMDSSLGYLESLARNYARLTPRTTLGLVDVNSVMRDVAAAATAPGGLARGSETAPVKIELRVPEQPLKVLGEPLMLRRIVDNLLRNAIESIEGPGGKVSLETSHAGDIVRVRVADTGRGMSDEQLRRAFDDFYTTKPGGTGLGLSVVRRLVADLNGSLKVNSEVGRGTTFVVELPAQGEAKPTRSAANPPQTPSVRA
jgi:signal transduction histidine kinase